MFGESLRPVHGELQGLLAAEEMSKTLDVVLIPASWAPISFLLILKGRILLTLAKGKDLLRRGMRICHHSPDLSPTRSRYFRLKGV